MPGHRQFAARREDAHARDAASASSGGSTNVVSEKFISRAMACIVVGVEARAVGEDRELVARERRVSLKTS